MRNVNNDQNHKHFNPFTTGGNMVLAMICADDPVLLSNSVKGLEQTNLVC
uniref:Uncharacterized protein n=1 Tax=Arion vulgaris TaxID=1028688 RepID=A0A0B7BTI1_9EUPU